MIHLEYLFYVEGGEIIFSDLVLMIKTAIIWFSKSILIGLIIALAAGILAPVVLDCLDQKHQKEELLSNIKRIYIGCNKEWLDAKLGPPLFKCSHETLMEYLYVTDYAAIRTFFDNKTGNCEAFFTTVIKNKSSERIELPDVYSWMSNHKPLGDFNYNDIDNNLVKICGYVGNGVVDTFYTECFYSGGSGNYYEFYFATMQYGKNLSGSGERSAEFSLVDEALLDEDLKKLIDKERTVHIMYDRKDSKPNTFGISRIPYESIIDVLMGYDGFDSLQMRMENE